MSEFQLPQVAVIDFSMGNLFSVKQACEHASLRAVITSKKEEIINADAVILPGVGAFGDAMATLKKLDLIGAILDFVKSGKPFLGICLGMQLLMSESEEFGQHKGLCLIKGRVVKFPVKNGNSGINKVPQVGWNQLNKPQFANEHFWDGTPLSGIRDGEFMYFVHSYYCITENTENILSNTIYSDIEYCSSISWKNIFACQFHPEKSALGGLKIYKNWSLLVKNIKELKWKKN